MKTKTSTKQEQVGNRAVIALMRRAVARATQALKDGKRPSMVVITEKDGCIQCLQADAIYKTAGPTHLKARFRAFLDHTQPDCYVIAYESVTTTHEEASMPWGEYVAADKYTDHVYNILGFDMADGSCLKCSYRIDFSEDGRTGTLFSANQRRDTTRNFFNLGGDLGAVDSTRLQPPRHSLADVPFSHQIH